MQTLATPTIIETPKSEHYVATSDVYHKANADASDPSYANFESVK